MIGWMNCTLKDRRLSVAQGFIDRQPTGPDFRSAFDAEVGRMERFVGRVD